LGELTALPRPPSCISGVLLLRKKGKRKNRGKERRKRRRKQEGRKKREEKETRSPIHVSGYATEKQRGRATKRERTKGIKN